MPGLDNPAGSIISGRQTVTANGTAVQLSTTSTAVLSIAVQAATDNPNAVTVGGPDVVGAVATRKGIALAAGAFTTDKAVAGQLAAPTYNNRGAVVSGTGAVAPNAPACLVGDILILSVETHDEAVALSGSPTDTWTEVGNAASAGATRLTVFWSRTSSTTPTMPQVDDPGDHASTRCISITGCIASGTPWEALETGADDAASTSCTITAGGTTLGADRMILYCISADGPDLNQQSGNFAFDAPETGPHFQAIDNARAAGLGGAMSINLATKPVAGTIQPSDVTLTTEQKKAFMAFALKPVESSSGHINLMGVWN